MAIGILFLGLVPARRGSHAVLACPGSPGSNTVGTSSCWRWRRCLFCAPLWSARRTDAWKELLAARLATTSTSSSTRWRTFVRQVLSQRRAWRPTTSARSTFSTTSGWWTCGDSARWRSPTPSAPRDLRPDQRASSGYSPSVTCSSSWSTRKCRILYGGPPAEWVPVGQLDDPRQLRLRQRHGGVASMRPTRPWLAETRRGAANVCSGPYLPPGSPREGFYLRRTPAARPGHIRRLKRTAGGKFYWSPNAAQFALDPSDRAQPDAADVDATLLNSARVP